MPQRIDRRRLAPDAGFSLLEMLIAVGILSVISALAFVVVRASHESASLAAAKSTVQQNVRDVMTQLTRELESAYAEPPPGVTTGRVNAQNIAVAEGGAAVTFWRPEADPEVIGHIELGPINLAFNTDAPEDPDPEEVYPGRVLRGFGGESAIVGAADNISALEFELLPHLSPNDNRLTRLRIRVAAAERHGLRREHVVRAELETIINLKN